MNLLLFVQDAAFKLLQNHMSSVSYDMAGDSNHSTTAASLVDDRSFQGYVITLVR